MRQPSKKDRVKRILILVLIGVGSFPFLLIIVFILAVIFIPCAERTSSIENSPNKQYFAFSQDMNCHSTAPYVGSVIVKQTDSQDLPFNITNSKNTVLGYPGTKDDVEIKWLDDKNLQVKILNCREIYGHEQSWRDISITYENLCNNVQPH